MTARGRVILHFMKTLKQQYEEAKSRYNTLHRELCRRMDAAKAITSCATDL